MKVKSSMKLKSDNTYLSSGSGLWKRNASAPSGLVARPIPGQLKGYSSFNFVDNYGPIAFEWLWTVIKQLTELGQLGYWSSFSDDSQYMTVHYASPSESNRIEDKLLNLGVNGIRSRQKIYTKLTAHTIKSFMKSKYRS